MYYKNLDTKKKKIRRFIRAYPTTTYKEIKKVLHIKLEKVYAGGIREAFSDARIGPPRNFKRMSKEEKKDIIINYIRKNQTVGGHKIRKDTKINFLSIFKNTEEAYNVAGIKYPRKDFVRLIKRQAETKRMKILQLLRENPLLSLDVIGKLTKCHPYSLFLNTKQIYEKAGIGSKN